jgi:hypothetical protein
LETPEKREFVEKIIVTLFPESEHVGQVRCLGKVSMDGRDYDRYDYDFYRDRESARTLAFRGRTRANGRRHDATTRH